MAAFELIKAVQWLQSSLTTATVEAQLEVSTGILKIETIMLCG